MPPFDELIESGKVVGLNFPVALNPALAKTIGTLLKVDYQRAVQLRIPKSICHSAPSRRLTVVSGDPGAGKTTLFIDWFRRLSRETATEQYLGAKLIVQILGYASIQWILGNSNP